MLCKYEKGLGSTSTLIRACLHSCVCLRFRQFVRLCKSDQRQLLARNTSLFIQLLLACYFGAFNGAEQLGFVLNYRQQQHIKEEVEDQTVGRERRHEIIHSNIHSLNSICNLFKPDTDLLHYSRLINEVKTLQLDGIEQQAILAYIVLFDYDSTMNLKDPAALTDINVLNEYLYESCVKRTDKTFSLQNLTSTLVKMALFSSYNIVWSETDLTEEKISKQALEMRYTEEEESWLQSQVHLVLDAYRSVPIADDTLGEIAMFTLGVPLSKNFIKVNLALGHERTWRIFLTQPEFVNLPPFLRHEIKCKNIFSALALIIARSESCANGSEQLRFSFGIVDENLWKEKFDKVFGSATLTKIEFFPAASSLPIFQTGVINDVMQSAFVEAVSLVKDPILWGLLLLITVTEPTEGILQTTPLAKLHSRYHLLLKRRIRWISASQDSPSDPDECLAKVLTVLQNVNKFAAILQCAMQSLTS